MAETKEEILELIHDFCWGNENSSYMLGKGCKDCPINHLQVCDEGKGGKLITAQKLKRAEEIISEVLQNGR